MTPPSDSHLGEDLRLVERVGNESATAWLWWREVPSLPGEKLGVIGNFSADGPNATAALLPRAEGTLAEHGCTLAVGPMDGNTWRRYRFVTAAGNEPPFYLEPANPATWPLWWQAAGYHELATYFSTATDDLAQPDARVAQASERLTTSGITLRPLDLARFEDDLTRIYDVSIAAFTRNFLYTALPAENFLAQYRALKEHVVPELVLIAEHETNAVGYVFAFPDFAQSQRGEPLTTIIVKTLAVRPGRAYAGLGAWLLNDVQQAARRLGFTRAIHALMHESNASRNLSAHYAQPLRRYALLAKKISQ